MDNSLLSFVDEVEILQVEVVCQVLTLREFLWVGPNTRLSISHTYLVSKKGIVNSIHQCRIDTHYFASIYTHS